ncbi:MAG: MotA/TolQ/ExbB proton channel family protein [Lentisphaeria bacterium]|nr:MotA/TolQ/ExbB proton channel family protein [Lentisphaeria bacterium]
MMYRMREAMAERRKTLDIFRMMIRIAPALGLLGTLIPMGSALAGVGQGEMQVASSELVVAFTTTVVGLAAGSIAYVIYAVKNRWVTRDIRQIEFITEKLCR